MRTQVATDERNGEAMKEAPRSRTTSGEKKLIFPGNDLVLDIVEQRSVGHFSSLSSKEQVQ